MNGIILASREGIITGRALAEELEIPCVKQIDYSSNRYQFCFRYGNTTHIPDEKVGCIINKAWGIRNASNKYETKRVMIDREIPTPQLFTYENIISDSIKYPIIARPKHHFKGREFYVVESVKDAIACLTRGRYLQEIIDKKDEYRIFIFKDKIFESNIKKNSGTEDSLIRNRATGWIFNIARITETPQILKDYSRRILEALGLEFGAVDCCIDKMGKPYVFEVNTAPALIDRKVSKLARKIEEWYGYTF